MSADPFMERVQARIVDLAEQSWRDARLAETEAAGSDEARARANLRAAILRSLTDREPVELPDFTGRTDANGDDWDEDPEGWTRHSFTLDRDTYTFFGPSPILPTSEQYADAERLLRARGPLDADAARLRCWITDTRPLAVKAGWIADEDLDDYDYTTITDSRILADLASRAPRPSLWTRISGWIK